MRYLCVVQICHRKPAVNLVFPKLKSFMLELSSKYVDENWEGSPKSRLLSEVISPRCSRVCRSSMCVALILC
ncbi:hypothetical protein scyTo_0001933 [Scyliorhinus torazame]|uniref:Uncharacterized protein n=1 Tax=Scyliorhinus torazame TaxID=75743 RepID=A0A401PGR5_SCYTO|nr:hypothetical protein [Scyliorhinus torazame]